MRALLEGNWQSCREPDGKYSERVYDNTLPGIGPFELHLGPYHEFALFRGVQDAHRDHSSPDNLLSPFNVEVEANRARQNWETAGLRLEVSLGGGARDDCESWFVTLKRTRPGVVRLGRNPMRKSELPGLGAARPSSRPPPVQPPK